MRSSIVLALCAPVVFAGRAQARNDCDDITANGWGTVVSTYTSVRMPPASPGQPGLIFLEPYVLVEPAAPLPDAPLVVIFHGIYGDQWEACEETTLMSEAALRGWYSVCMYGSSLGTWGGERLHRSVEAVLEAVLSDPSHSVDPAKLYGVGFSLGGGNVLSWAARHLDPGAPWGMLAAVVEIAGTASVSDVWYQSNCGTRDYIAQRLGLAKCWTDNCMPCTTCVDWMNCPSGAWQAPFRYRASSVVEYSPLGTRNVLGSKSMAHNLKHVPILAIVPSNQPQGGYLSYQTFDLRDFMWGVIGQDPLTEFVFQSPCFECQPGNCASNGHCWEGLDEPGVYAFLSGKTLAWRAGPPRA